MIPIRGVFIHLSAASDSQTSAVTKERWIRRYRAQEETMAHVMTSDTSCPDGAAEYAFRRVAARNQERDSRIQRYRVHVLRR